MGRPKRTYYSSSVLLIKQKFYKNLQEKAARHFLGQEYLDLGKGSQRYLSEVFGCSRQTIKKGADEISHSDFEADYSRQRKIGAGRKKRG